MSQSTRSFPAAWTAPATDGRSVGRRCSLFLACVFVAAVALVIAAGGADAAAAPHWTIASVPAPSDFHPGDESDIYEVIAQNDGSAHATGETTIKDILPSGLKVSAVAANAEVTRAEAAEEVLHIGDCSQETTGEQTTVTCATPGEIPVGRSVVLDITVAVPEGISGTLLNVASISGGGAATSATTENQTLATPAALPVPYGAWMTSDLTNTEGEAETQAGSHPFDFNTTLSFSSDAVNVHELCFRAEIGACAETNQQVKDVEVALPPGMAATPTAVPQCTQWEFEREGANECPADTQVGYVYLYFYGGQTDVQQAAVYNVEPPPRQPAELGFSVSAAAHIPVFFRVRNESDDGLTAYVPNANQYDVVRVAAMSIWGVPSSSAHNSLRITEDQPNCGYGEEGCSANLPTERPFLTMPTSCSGSPLPLVLSSDSWQDPESVPATRATTFLPEMTGCGLLAFHPAIVAAPTTRQAGSPTGLDVDVEVPQSENPEGLAAPDIRDIEVALPVGTDVSPSGANGLASCSPEQFALKHGTKGSCPGESKIGTVRLSTPALSVPLVGSLYVGEPECDPCDGAQAEAGEMVPLFLEAEGSGVVIKLAGHTKINQATGQVTSVFAEDPQLPASNVEVDIEPGADAPVVNPSSCGPEAVSAAVTPWSSSAVSDISAPLVSIEGCSPAGFAPSFAAGSTGSGRGGGFAGFAVSLSRGDSEQTLGQVSVTTPPGLLGVLKNVVQCPEAQANAGTCPAGSQIGTGSIVAGPGSAPLSITGGKVYLTGPYDGEPFGLSIVTPTQAGPFVLAGNTGAGTEVVRASIAVNPQTSALTITSGSLPQALDGIPLDIRTVNINVNRGEFTFNPTNCGAQSVSGTITSGQGTNVPVAAPFQAVDCATLPFKPVFTASTGGQASKADGASLTVKIAAKGGPQTGGGEANIKSVKVDLPKQLPSRLSTLQLACTEAQFNANPAGCPKESDVGTATAATPVLAHPLEGPAYLVSHGGAAFPDLEIVLQGEGITLILDGQTNIKDGITSSTFKTVPDAPISSFELKLPTGAYSILGTDLPTSANYRLCGQTLAMPTMITGQNGAVIKQTTKITITGCPKAKTLSRAQKLTRALKACKKDESKSKRAACEATARKHYAPTKTKKHKK